MSSLHVVWTLCCFRLGLVIPLESFYSFEKITITIEGLQILTYALNSWPLNSETLAVDDRLHEHLRWPITSVVEQWSYLPFFVATVDQTHSPIFEMNGPPTKPLWWLNLFNVKQRTWRVMPMSFECTVIDIIIYVNYI